MKKYVLFSLFLLSINAFGVPASRREVVRTQPNGTQIVLRLFGDEHFHYYKNENDEVILKDLNGYYKKVSNDVFEMVKKQSAMLKTSRYLLNANKNANVLTRNIAQRGLVVLVNFADVSFQSENDAAAYSDMLNKDNYSYSYTVPTDYGSITVAAMGSAKEYFVAQSYGKYTPQFDVVGPITLANNRKYYGANDAGGDDVNAEGMVIEACQAVDAQVDFAQYDNDADGYIDFVYILYAGEGEADGGDENSIWPHAWELKNKKITLDGKTLNTYACSNEINYLGKRDGIGTFCHEFSHVLGLPDLYTTNSSDHKTMGAWDIMDYGPYNNYGFTPPAYSAYERWFMGWLTPTILNKTQESVSLNELNESQEAFLVTATGEHSMDGLNPDPAEFYILENRQQNDWDQYLPGNGMLITKVNFNYYKWYGNSVNNNADNMCVDLIEADGVEPRYGWAGYAGKPTDAFPKGATKYNSLFDYPISAITQTNGVISFAFNIASAIEETEIDEYKGQIKAIYDIHGNAIDIRKIDNLQKGTVYILLLNDRVKKIRIR